MATTNSGNTYTIDWQPYLDATPTTTNYPQITHYATDNYTTTYPTNITVYSSTSTMGIVISGEIKELIVEITEQLDSACQTVRYIEAALSKVPEDEVDILLRWRDRASRKILKLSEKLVKLSQNKLEATPQTVELPLEPEEPEFRRLKQGLGLD